MPMQGDCTGFLNMPHLPLKLNLLQCRCRVTAPGLAGPCRRRNAAPIWPDGWQPVMMPPYISTRCRCQISHGGTFDAAIWQPGQKKTPAKFAWPAW